MRLAVAREADAPVEGVWALLTAWERQPDWMVDARSVEVLTPDRVGEGVVIRCPTNLFGVTVDDVMRVTAWDDPNRLEVTHLGRVVRGRGEFALEALGPRRTRITWTEDVTPPLGAVGEWGARRVALPALRRLFGRSLRNLAELAERETPPP